MKSVGLITIHRIPNCGSLLQTWATVECINKLGYDCTLIDYRYPTWHHTVSAIGDENKAEKFATLKKLLRCIKLLDILKHLNFCRRLFFDNRFIASFLSQIKRTQECDYRTVSRFKKSFDIFVTGSDQTWNPRYLGDDYSFLLDFTTDKARRVAYSASFGCNKLPHKYEPDYARLIRRYDAISTREPSGVELVKTLCGKEAVAVVDPTLLMTKEDYILLSANKIPAVRRFVFCYVLTYVFNPGDCIVEATKDVAKRLNAEVIFYCDAPYRIPALRNANFDIITGRLSVADFLEYYMKSVFVVTTSFHGTAFSLNFRKNFLSVVNPNASADDRVTSFLKRFGLAERGLKPIAGRPLEIPSIEIDYSLPSQKLEDAKRMSIAFLRSALGDC